MATLIVHEEWTGTTLDQRVFNVSGTENSYVAKRASGIPVEDQAHPFSPSKTVQSVSVANGGNPTYWKVTVTYGESSGGGSRDPDPLKQPAEFQWIPSTISQAVDRDVKGNPYLNSAAQPITGRTRPETVLTLIIRKNIRPQDFSPRFSLKMMNKVNFNSWKVDNEFIGRGEGKITFIGPTTSHNRLTVAVPLEIRIEFRPDWFARFLDKGTRREAESSTDPAGKIDPANGRYYVPILGANNMPTSEPALLNGKGGMAGTNVGSGAPGGAKVEDVPGGKAKFLIYEDLEAIDFSPLDKYLI